ncbi:FkbM family methyltransferase [Nitratireductor rhodophyticola]|uniref:FkbM family methyltransferase n=1 Tax=Nitratireductor rhodophyticola TaxID=2854036 RepID=UPI003BABBF62
MTFVSYAQNFEDVILWRALKHVEKGFYIDVGAQDPVIESVSLAFYENGWRGVHVEADPHYAQLLREARPDEDVIEAAAGREDGEIEFFAVADTGLGTGDKNVARTHEADGRIVKPSRVRCMRFNQILDRYGEQAIHWLKIDVEGMEESVIDGWGSSKVRPWVVVVESTFPLTTKQNHSTWEPKLFALGYEFCYFDGLNRFYVSKEHPELKVSFGPGPNFFDDFVLGSALHFCRGKNLEDSDNKAEPARRQNSIDSLVKRLADEQSFRHKLEANLSSLRREMVAANAAHHQQMEAIYNSTSWRITAPLRALSSHVRWFMRGSWAWLTLKPGSRPRRLASTILVKAARFVLSRPKLARPVKQLLQRMPVLDRRLRALIVPSPSLLSGLPVVVRDVGDLSPKGRGIYEKLSTAIEERQRKG